MTASEHILLESDLRQVPDLRDARKSHGRLKLRSRLRRRVLQLEIIDYYYLSVRSRTGVTGLEFSLDLRFARAPQLSVRFIKRAVRDGLRSDLRSALDLISSHYAVVATSTDHREAVAAYLEKRKPVFTGR